MVQERRGMGLDKTSPLKPIRPSPGTGNEKMEKAEQDKRDRIQRYKEERRKQMAARYGTKEASSSDEDDAQNASSGSVCRRRRRPRSGLNSSTDALDIKRCPSSELIPDLRKRKGDGDPEEEFSAKGLHRAPLRSSTTPTIPNLTLATPITTTSCSSSNNNNEPILIQDVTCHAVSAAGDASPDLTNQRSRNQDGGRLDSADSTLSGSEGRPGVRRRTSLEEKDKSHKRKSHLNRASTSEEAVYPPAPHSHLSDSSEDIPRRRRRRAPQATASDSPYNSSPSTATSDATPRLTPPGTSPSSLGAPGDSTATSSSYKTPNLPPVNPILPLRNSGGTGTYISAAKSELRTEFDVVTQQDGGKLSSLRSGSQKFTPSKASPLRKPDIPEVLRNKDQPGGVTSPGVVLTPSNSRPTSVVIEKPPVGPEGGVGRGPAFRPSLRKPQDAGTCFMASRRERKDDDLTTRNGEDVSSSSIFDLKSKESSCDIKDHLEGLTAQALQLKSRAEVLNGETMVLECEQYLKINKDFTTKAASAPPREVKGDSTNLSFVGGSSLSSDGGVVSDSGQKNWLGGSEGNSDKSWRLVYEGKECPSSPVVPSGPPFNADNGAQNTPFRKGSRKEEETTPLTEKEDIAMLRRRSSSKEDFSVLSSAEKSQGILKRSSCPKIPSFEFQDSEPRPILKKKSSAEEDPLIGDPRKKSILKKKSLTDDELDWDRPRSILKGARSREDLMDRNEGVASPPTPILKRGSKDLPETEGGELRPILKRRDTTDGVRNAKVDSGEGNEPPLIRRDSAPLPSCPPSHGILKRRSEEASRPRSPSLDLLTSNERPLSVAERVAGMEALQGESQGAKPKVRSRPSSGERPTSPSLLERETRRSNWTPNDGDVAPSRTLPEGFTSSGQSSRVSQKAAFFAKLEQEKNLTPPLSPSVPQHSKKDRGTRFATQPITEGEVNKASKLFDAPPSGNAEGDANLIIPAENTSSHEANGVTLRKQSNDSLSSIGRRMSAQELSYEENFAQESIRGILKSDPLRERAKDGPKSILKADSRKSSFSEGEQQHPRGILKSDTPISPAKRSPEHDSRSLKSVLKKDSSSEDSKEIKSILKKESESLDPDVSSDSSSEITLQDLSSPYLASEGVVQTVNAALVDSLLGSSPEMDQVLRRPSVDQHTMKEAVKQALPMKAKDNLAEALRQIEPLRDKSRERSREEESVGTKVITKEDVLSNIREKAQKKNDDRETRPPVAPFSPRKNDVGHFFSGDKDEDDDDDDDDDDEMDGEIHEIKATFEENMRSLSGLQEEMRTPRERVTFRQKVRQQKVTSHKDRWTLNDFTPNRSKVDSSPIRSPPSSGNSSSTCSSSSPPVGSRRMKPSPELFCATVEEKTFSKLSLSSSAVAISSSTPDGDGVGLSSSVGSSINARLLSLQKHGEEGWKNRLQRDEDLLSPKTSRPRVRPTSLLERVSLLESSSQQWKDRVSQSDATKFTVAHKMASASSVPSLVVSSSTKEEAKTFESSSAVQTTSSTEGLLSPASERRKRRSPQPKVFKSKTGSCLPDIINAATTSTKDPVGPPKEFARSISIPSAGTKEEEEEECSTVTIPRLDDESFNSFFASSVPMTTKSEMEEFDTSDFDLISSNTSHLVVKRRNVRVTRKTQTTRNPLKSLAEREDIKDEYKQVVLGAGDRELRRMKVEELSKSSSLAMEALAGLASRENFSAVALKKVEENPVTRELAPYSELMLIQIKGRRHPQVRLVNPKCESVNEGDDFLLITPHELFHYKGKFANVIERAVASEMALYILQTKDMGVTSALKVTDVEETSPTAKKERFWSKIGGNSECQGQPPGPPDSDDHVEASLIASNKVFEVRGHSLVPFEEAWGQSPKYELLSSDKVLVFDFGSEVYIWTGKRATMEEKRQGTLLVKDLWKEDFDYSDCDINPICLPLVPGEQTQMKGSRPRWGICGKITENVETILFKEKFLDWPDTAQQTRIKEVRIEFDQKVEPVCDLEPCDANEMITSEPEEPDLILEMSHLGRGVVYYDEEERRLHNISTNDFKVWHISENEKKALSGFSAFHFFSGETYVVRWYYHVTATGRTLKGTPSRHNVTGRSRVAYFFWQGQSSSISDKGVSALMTVELDEERGPHIRVTMNSEPPAFLNLFEGGLVIHRGRREDADQSDESCGKKMFVVRGEMPNEAHLIEEELNQSLLRSRGCVVLVDLKGGIVYLWIGSKALPHSKQVGKTAATLLSKQSAEEMGWREGLCSPLQLKEEMEGTESSEFLRLLGRSKLSPESHFPLAKDVTSAYDWTTRMWVLEAKPDSFLASEITSPYRATDRPCAFPVWQEELYSTPQPAIFLVDAGLKIYIWQGWFPEENSEEENSSVTGSAYLRFTFARRAALQTAVRYVRKKEEMIKKKSLKNGSFSISDCASILNPKLVVAGLESLEFKNLFPVWKPRKDVTNIQKKEGRWKDGEEYCVREVLNQLCKEQYTLEELQMVPLPDGVDPSRLEKYLSDGEFRETLGVSKREFLSLPSWKQLQLKKKGNLF